MTKCIICNREHSRLWINQEPALYCGTCADLRQDAVGTLTHVVGTLYLGDATAAAQFNGQKICVHENPAYMSPSLAHHVPILIKSPRSQLDRSGAVASLEALDKVCNLIATYTALDERIIVHCAGGVERSPLAVAYFLSKTWITMTKFNLETAYAYLKKIRPVVSERYQWLPQAYWIAQSAQGPQRTCGEYCPKRSDGATHCNCWWDEKPCCTCGAE